MALTDYQIRAIAPAHFQKFTNAVLAEFSGAIEAAAVAPLLERIAALEAQVEQAAQLVAFKNVATQAMSDFEVTKSIIYECPAIRLPQSFLEKLGMTAQIVALKGATPEMAAFIAAACNQRTESLANQDPVAWHVVHHGSAQIFTSLESLDLTDCTISPLYTSPPKAAPLTDEQWLEFLLKTADAEALHVAAFVGQTIQTQGRWQLYAATNKLRKLVEQAHGITPATGEKDPRLGFEWTQAEQAELDKKGNT